MSWPEPHGPMPRRRIPPVGQWPVVWWIIGLNVLVFTMDTALHRVLTRAGGFAPAMTIWGLQLWRFLTFQFLHADTWHLIFNMVSLFYFGQFVERRLGRVRFTYFYLLCGAAGALVYLLLCEVGFLPWGNLIGASAGVFGVLVAAASVVPDARVMLMFPPIPMRLKTMVWVFLGIGLLTVISAGRNAGGEAAHLGGAALGWALMRFFNRPPPPRRSTFWKPGDPAGKFFRDV